MATFTIATTAAQEEALQHHVEYENINRRREGLDLMTAEDCVMQHTQAWLNSLIQIAQRRAEADYQQCLSTASAEQKAAILRILTRDG